MKLKSLEIAGFRGISDLDLEFPERVNVLVGVNGAGKSAVLDCAAIMLSHLLERIRSPTGRGRAFVEHDITTGVAESRNEIKLRSRGPPFIGQSPKLGEVAESKRSPDWSSCAIP